MPNRARSKKGVARTFKSASQALHPAIALRQVNGGFGIGAGPVALFEPVFQRVEHNRLTSNYGLLVTGCWVLVTGKKESLLQHKCLRRVSFCRLNE